ncbi:hypothetical protein ACIPL1_18365 [Pseudomonas sp. NPDC090202]|uniref:hypothetical protein n=1 Tax=unclassified Pseudomonas TaxID=196821 RepID=UPI00382E7323
MERIEHAITLLQSLIACQTSTTEALIQIAHEMENGHVAALSLEKLQIIERTQLIVTACVKELATKQM